MTVTAAQVAQLRRMVAEPTAATYNDTLLTDIIETYPMMDERGTMPYYWTQTGGVPTQTENTAWYPTYNLNMAAAQVWEEKAATIADRYDFSADGGNYSRSQAYKHASERAKHYRSLRGVTTFRLHKSPKESAAGTFSDAVWIGNLPESDDYDGDDVSFLVF